VGAFDLTQPEPSPESVMKVGNSITAGMTGGLAGTAMMGGESLRGSLADGNSIGDALKDARNNAVLMGVTEGLPSVAQAGSKGAKSIGAKAGTFAEEQAVKSLNPIASQKALLDKKTGIGRTLLDDGVVTPFASKSTMADRVRGLNSNVGEEISDLLGSVKTKIDPQAVVNDFFDKTLAKDASVATRLHEANAYLNNPTLNNLGKSKPLSMKEAQAEKIGLDDAIGNWEKQNLGAKDRYSRDLRGELNTKMEDAAGSEGKREIYQALKKKYGDMALVQKVIDKSSARAGANNGLSLTDFIAGGIGTSIGGPVGGAVGAGARTAVRKYGNQIAAVIGDKAAQQLSGKYLDILAAAAERGKTALVVTNALLLKNDPEYAAAVGN